MTPGVWDNVLAWETVYLDIIAPLFAHMKAVILAEGRRVEYYERGRKVLDGKKLFIQHLLSISGGRSWNRERI